MTPVAWFTSCRLTFPRFSPPAFSETCAANKSFTDSLLWIISAFEGRTRGSRLRIVFGKVRRIRIECLKSAGSAKKNGAEFSLWFTHALLSLLTFVDPTWEHETVRKARFPFTQMRNRQTCVCHGAQGETRPRSCSRSSRWRVSRSKCAFRIRLCLMGLRLDRRVRVSCQGSLLARLTD